MTDRNRLAVVAIGGNSLIIDKNRKTIEDQFDAVKQTVSHIGGLIADGWDVAGVVGISGRAV